jgi:hypothetical protein
MWIVTSAHSNVLIEGPETVTERAVAILARELRAPLGEWNGGTPDAGVRTLVVRAVDGLDGDGQRALLDYLAVANPLGSAQVVATSVQPVFPLVGRGLFLEDLYYRLNTVLLSLHDDQ